MTEQQEKARFRQAVDHTLSGLTGDPFLYQRVTANAEKGAKPVKYHFPKGLVIALIAILAMCTVAVAAGVYGGTVNWLGEVVPDERPEIAYPTMLPEELEAEINRSVHISDLMRDLEHDGELLVLYEAQEDGEFYPSASNSLKRRAKDLDTLMALLDGADNMPLPNFIPDGYEFAEGEVMYTCREGGEWRLANQAELEEGVRAEWYHLSAEDALVRGYYMLFRNSPEDYHYIAIYVDLSEMRDVSEQSFGFLEDQTVQVVAVPGMDNALAITSDHACNLSMRRALEAPVGHLRFSAGERPELLTYGEVNIDVHAPLLDADTLIRMFAVE